MKRFLLTFLWEWGWELEVLLLHTLAIVVAVIGVCCGYPPGVMILLALAIIVAGLGLML